MGNVLARVGIALLVGAAVEVGMRTVDAAFDKQIEKAKAESEKEEVERTFVMYEI